jgi:hypothetical protein
VIKKRRLKLPLTLMSNFKSLRSEISSRLWNSVVFDLSYRIGRVALADRLLSEYLYDELDFRQKIG